MSPRHRLPRRAPGSSPAVVFVEDEGWASFYQLAASIRRLAVRVVRISLARPGSAIARVPVVYDWTPHVTSPEELDRLPSLLRGERVVDAQCAESLAARVYPVVADLVDDAKGHRLRRRAASVDKRFVGETLADAGVCVPATIACAGATAADVVDTLGLPAVLKPAVGSGGQRVLVVRTRAELDCALAAVERPEEMFIERFVHGRPYQMGVLANAGTVQLGAACETLERGNATGPATRIVTVEDEQLFAVARDVVAALGLDGLSNMNVIRDDAGRVWVHDVNPRVWGSFAVYAAAGTDFVRAYVDSLAGTHSGGPSRWAAGGVHARVPPADFTLALGAPGRVDVAVAAARALRAYGERFGWRYVAFLAVNNLGPAAGALLGRPPTPRT